MIGRDISEVGFARRMKYEKEKEFIELLWIIWSSRSYGIFAAIALGMMMVGALGMNIVPKDYFGIVERFSVFAATGYNAVLGIELFRMNFSADD